MHNQSPIAQTVEKACESLLDRNGYELILVEFLPQSRLLRMYIDCRSDPALPERVITLDDCTQVSRLVSEVLDDDGIMEGASGHPTEGYRLEVSSPGLDRPLTKPAHFSRFVGENIHVSTRGRLGGLSKRRFHATLLGADADGINVSIDEHAHRIAYTELDKAHLVATF